VGPLGVTRPGGGRVADAIEIVVKDSGIGIAREQQARIFDAFFQVDSSSTREFGGTGLGLALVKSFAEAHGGAVWVESEYGRGSAFHVWLPLDERDEGGASGDKTPRAALGNDAARRI
jgi:signal transduction histidine kinase